MSWEDWVKIIKIKLKRKGNLQVFRPLSTVSSFWFFFSLISEGGFSIYELTVCFYSNILLYISSIEPTPISFASTCLLRTKNVLGSFTYPLSFILDKSFIHLSASNFLAWTHSFFYLLHLSSRLRMPANPKLRASHQLKSNSDSLNGALLLRARPKFWC